MTEKEFIEAFKDGKVAIKLERSNVDKKIFEKLKENGFKWKNGDDLDYENDKRILCRGEYIAYEYGGVCYGYIYNNNICKIVKYSDIDWEEEFPKVEITTDGRNTIAKLIEHGEVVKEGTARLNSSDEFDFKTGASYAFARLFGLGLNDTEKVLVEEENEEKIEEFSLQPNDRVKVNICSGYYGHIKEVEDYTVVVEIEIEEGFKGDVTVSKEDVEFVYRAVIRTAKTGEYIMTTNKKHGFSDKNILFNVEVGTVMKVIRGENLNNACKAKVLGKELICYLHSYSSDYVVLEGYDPERFPDA